MDLSKPARDPVTSAAIEIVEAAGPIALQYFRREIPVVNKLEGRAFDPVTEADREIERFIRAELERRYPDDGVLGEEEAPKRSRSGRSWVLDPIDGTRSFISGSPEWGVLLGVVEARSCAVGVLHQPYLGETFVGAAERAWCRMLEPEAVVERTIATRETRRLEDAIVRSTHPDLFETTTDRAAFERVANRCRLLRWGGDCYSYALLALGCIDLVAESGLHAWDVQPLIPIVEGAGGVITNAEGHSAMAGGFVVASATPELHREVLAVLRGDAG